MINNGEPMSFTVGGWIDAEDIIWTPGSFRGVHRGCGGEVYSDFYGGGGVKCRQCLGWNCV